MENLLVNIKDIEPDSIIRSAGEYKEDKCKDKVNLSIGVCCTEEGELHIFKSVLDAEKIVFEKYKEKPYLLGNGTKEFSTLTQELIFGNDSKYIKEKRICTIQTIGGTGAIFIILQFLKSLNADKIYVTNIPYINHVNMIKSYGFNIEYIQFFDYKVIDIDYTSFLTNLRNIENKSIIILQISCYNPCSVNIDINYFNQIAEIVLEKSHLIIFDIAYQGFGGSDMNEDVLLIREFQEREISFAVCQSFSKNMSLYGERAGALHIVCKNKSERQIVFNNLRMIVRRYYSSPVIHTNRIVCELLQNQKLKYEWIKELRKLSERITTNRLLFLDKLTFYQKKYNLNYDWEVYKKQRGMFSFIPLLANISDKLKQYHIYIIANGRINVSGVTKRNVDLIAERICQCLSEL
ncbi:aspartate aminotransferase, putative [Plasmodium malariae]|uniref:Aspartate aminotransferase n=1 Tax=Plasmodium malariae TaxID=5858 RepID=A0A1C3KAY5_PLAMA|nr:aspartate aminotransferase, putative [Plasmodium malariae]